MLSALSIGLIGVAMVFAIRWLLTPHDALGRPQAFPLLGVALPAVGAVLCSVPVVQHVKVEGSLGEVASSIVGKPVAIRCETLSQSWMSTHTERGYVMVSAAGRPDKHAVLTHDTCQTLAQLRQNPTPGRLSDDQVIAIHVLTHEAMHLRGLVAEDRAECAAIQRDRGTARLLGVPAAHAQDMVARYVHDMYPQLPADYRSAQCRRGGSLDEHLTDSPWETSRGVSAVGATSDQSDATVATPASAEPIPDAKTTNGDR